jgi:hypothetical protein
VSSITSMLLLSCHCLPFVLHELGTRKSHTYNTPTWTSYILTGPIKFPCYIFYTQCTSSMTTSSMVLFQYLKSNWLDLFFMHSMTPLALLVQQWRSFMDHIDTYLQFKFFSIIKRKFKQSTIPQISTNLNNYPSPQSLSTKKTMTYDVGNPGSGSKLTLFKVVVII